MANASGTATDRLMQGKFAHAPSGVEYQVSSEDSAAWLSYRRSREPAISGREKLEYFLGSGHLGLTYLYTKNNYLLESPVAYFPELQSYSMKPGLENIRQFPGALPIDSSCLRCHMSATQRSDQGTENRYQGLPFLHTGITCESCHGDTCQHVATNGKATVINPTKLDAVKRDSTCIVCHLEGATSVVRRDRSALDYKPGENIADYLTYFAYASEKTTERGVSEIEQFTSSKCKRVTGAAMSCMNCHDPHRSPAPAERVAFYRSKCLTCHTQPKYATAHYVTNPDCTSCHMPKTGAKNFAHVAWTDHRIRQHPDADEAASSSEAARELRPILAGGAGPRDLGLAYYDLAVKGDLSAKARAIDLLTAVVKSSPEDAAVSIALGVLAEWDGDSVRSQELYRSGLKKQPDSFIATTNLGTLLAKSGNLDGAEAAWKPDFERNQDIFALGQNLATIECLLGRKERAIEVLNQVLIYSPDSIQVRNKLRAIQSGSQACSVSEPTLKLQNP